MLAVFTPLAAKFSSRFGYKHSVLVSVPLYVTFIYLLYQLQTLHIPLFILGLFLGASLAFYWMGMHLVFHRASHSTHRGEEVGKREGISILATMLGPIMGGLTIKYMGFNPVFISVAALLFFSAGILFLSKEKHIQFHLSLSRIFNLKEWKKYLFFMYRGMRAIAAGVVWPLFIFFIIPDYLSIGALEAVIAGVSALLIWLMGRYSDHSNRRLIVRIVASFESLGWIVRAFIASAGQVLGMTIFGAFSYGSLESPGGAMEYDNAKKDITSYFVSREIFLCLGRIVLLGLIILTGSLSAGIMLNGLATLSAFLL